MIAPLIRPLSIVSVLVLCSALYACAQQGAPAETPGSGVPQAVTDTLGRIIPDESPDEIRAAPFPGFREVVYGAQILYVSDDGRYALQGDLLDLESQENITESRRSEIRIGLLEALDRDEVIVFAPEARARHVVHVFTDVDCTYCRQLHREMDQYNELGIEVRYLAFPRSGVDSPLYHKMVSVWCAEDRGEAMTQAKAGAPVPSASCPNPVRDHLTLAADFGVNGTPTLVLGDGTTLPGYVAPARLAAYLDQQVRAR